MLKVVGRERKPRVRVMVYFSAKHERESGRERERKMSQCLDA